MTWLVFECFLSRFWSNAGERALQTSSGRSSLTMGNLWATRTSSLGWQRNERRETKCGLKRHGTSSAPVRLQLRRYFLVCEEWPTACEDQDW